MPMPGFLSSIADKAQSAINATPLAGHIPNVAQARPSSPDPAQGAPSPGGSQGGSKSHALETLSYQFRNLQQQYSSATTPVQRIITLAKGLAIDFDGVSRDAKAQSKELYTWGQSEQDDLKDVSDRLAYLNFVQGSLAGSLAAKLESARNPLKALRDAETNILPKRNIRAGIQTAIGRLEHEQTKGNDKKIAELREALKRAEADDQQAEKESELLKRKSVRESEQIKWDAIREYGEKLVLLAQAASPIIAVLPAIPPSADRPYTGQQTTGAIRASLQRALDNYKTGVIYLPPRPEASALSRSDTQSFGESHASELSNISSEISLTSAAHGTPVVATTALPAESPTSTAHAINPQSLNQSPAPLPTPNVTAVSTLVPVAAVVGAAQSTNVPPSVTPTIAETGVPVISGPAGPGPSSGTLQSSSLPPPAAALPVSPAKYATAEDEKRRLASLYSPPVQSPSTPSPALTTAAPPSGPTAAPPTTSGSSSAPTPQNYEGAEDEKKRLEREERERLLRGDEPPLDIPSKDEDLPPYQELGV